MRRYRYIAPAVGLALAAMLVVILIADAEPEQPAPEDWAGEQPPPGSAPNLLVVMTDDQALSSFTEDIMPRTYKLFADGGTFFEQAIAAPPLCCPSRAGFITGRYAHNHGVVDNDLGYRSLRNSNETLPTALQGAGYRTGMIGKFMNGYEAEAGAEPAPGFEYWYATFGYADYFDYQVSDQGEVKDISQDATTELTDKAIDFVGDSGDRRPFFLWLSYNAPHTVLPTGEEPCGGLDPQPPSVEAYEEFANSPLPRTASFDERDVSDKPSLAGGPGPIKAGRLEEITQTWRCSLAALRSVDAELSRLIQAMRQAGELEKTVVVYVSDNGYFFGEHRLHSDTRVPLEPALRVPMAIRVGELLQTAEEPATTTDLVSQVDLAPTLLDYAGVNPCRVWSECISMDGRSLRTLLEGDSEWPRDRGIPLELDDGWTYRALRSRGELYSEFERSRWRSLKPPALELYDLSADPDQLESLAETTVSAEQLRALGDRLDRLSRCAGVQGRDQRTGERPFCE